MSDNLAQKKRRVQRIQATRACNSLIGQLDSMDPEIKSQRITYLNTLMEELKVSDEIIFAELCSDDKVSDDAVETEYAEAADYTVKILDTIGRLQASIVTSTSVPQPVSPAHPQSSAPPAKFNLPQIPLPTFANKPTEDLTKFLTNFEQVIDKFNLPEYEKFLLLQKSLSGDPATIIRSLEISNQNYTGAKDLLTKAFSSKSTQQFNAIAQLLKLKLRPGDDPYKFISDFRLIKETFDTLNITKDEILQFHIWSGMNAEMQTHLINITNCNKPNLGEIEDNIFWATERYLAAAKTNKSYPENSYQSNIDATHANAAAVKNVGGGKVTFCSLCSTPETRENSHYTSNCPKYPDVQPQSFY